MAYYPVFLELTGRKVVVVGGGMVAQRKIETLLGYGAVIHLISRDITPDLQGRIHRGEINFMSREFNESHIEDAFLVIAATSDRALNQKVSGSAKRRNILVNAVDQPDDCSFIVPSIVKSGDLLIAISTSGKSPALAKRIREELMSRYGKEYGYFLDIMGRIRKQLLSRDIPEHERGGIFHELVDSPILESIRKKDNERVESELARILEGKFSRDDVINFMKEE